MSDTSPPTKYTVGLVQMAMSADPAANLEQAIAKVAEAARAGARLVCLPELFRSRYFAQREDAALFDLAEPVPGPRGEALGRGEIARPGIEEVRRGWPFLRDRRIDAYGGIVSRYLGDA